MPENKHLRFLLRLTYTVLGVAGIWFFSTVLLPWLLPFLIALGLAALLEPAVCFLMDQLKLPRWVASTVCTLLLTLTLCAALGLALWRVGYELALLLGRLPTLLSALPTLADQLEVWAYRFIIAAPVQFQDFFRETLAGIISQGISLPNQFYDWLAGLVTGAATTLPNTGLFLFTTGLATYFTSAQRPALLAFLRRQAPRTWRPTLREGMRQMKTAFGGWLRAQGILMLVTFGELALGFLFLRVDLALLLAALVSLVDALPVFGTGTVLLPWAVVTLLGGDSKTALGLFLLYGLVSFVRNLLEPKVMGQRLGLPPLAALLSMYLGFSAFGVAGMILAPLVTLFLKQLHDSGLVRLWQD